MPNFLEEAVKNQLGLNRDLSDEEKVSIKNAIKGGWSYTSGMRAKGAPITINIPKSPVPTFVFGSGLPKEIIVEFEVKHKQYRSIDEPFIPSVEQ